MIPMSASRWSAEVVASTVGLPGIAGKFSSQGAREEEQELAPATKEVLCRNTNADEADRDRDPMKPAVGIDQQGRKNMPPFHYLVVIVLSPFSITVFRIIKIFATPVHSF